MPMRPATQALVTRALRQREVADRAALMTAQQAHAAREAEARALYDHLAREGDGAMGDARLAGVVSHWFTATAARLAGAHHAAKQAEAACEPPREALTGTVRLQRGLAELQLREAADEARLAARRDPLQTLAALKSLLRKPGD